MRKKIFILLIISCTLVGIQISHDITYYDADFHFWDGGSLIKIGSIFENNDIRVTIREEKKRDGFPFAEVILSEITIIQENKVGSLRILNKKLFSTNCDHISYENNKILGTILQVEGVCKIGNRHFGYKDGKISPVEGPYNIPSTQKDFDEKEHRLLRERRSKQ